MEGGDSNNEAQPESTVALNFAADLDSMFGLSTGVATLSQTVEEKKASVSSGQSELEQLEARLRETEDRLRKVSRQSSPARQADSGAAQSSAMGNVTQTKQTSPLSHRPTYPDDRPPTGARPKSSKDRGLETQGANGRDDYVMVEGRTA